MTHQSFEPIPPAAAAAPTAAKRPFYKKKRFVIPTGLVLLTIVLGSCGGGKSATDAPASAPNAISSSSPAAATTEAPGAHPTQAAAARPASAAPTVGTPFTMDLGNGDVARITILSAVRETSVSAQFSSPAKNGTYLLLDVLWETTSGETSSNPFYFSAKDANGRKADQNLFVDDQLGSGKILPGDKSRGFIAFDVAAGPVTVMISDPLMQEAARIQIPG
ncbi:DUF4352 domain-containing protein [Paenarthrobacter ureafaciens]|uniref:DUF4352 domain-containing protein n=1 Tax=Paenarthrobacter ureafaciens TaxID=37931 RepID=UPI001A998D0C|nr:hypothetical protein [Paenarthrobacter ureafaciens]QSZ55642.1 hypothetical protein AYX19_21365 [Paenarthrobacter ureafaciens]